MQIKLKIHAFNHVPGDVIDVDPFIAKRYIECGDAVEYKQPKPEPVVVDADEINTGAAKRVKSTRLSNKSLSASE